MSAATQIYYASFDAVFVKLPPALRARIEREWSSRARTTWTGSPEGEAGAQPNQSTRSVYDSQPIHTIDLKGRIGTAPVSVTIESFTLSI